MITLEEFEKLKKRNKFLAIGYMIITISFSILGVFHYPFLLVALIALGGLSLTNSHQQFLTLSFQIQELKDKKIKI